MFAGTSIIRRVWMRARDGTWTVSAVIGLIGFLGGGTSVWATTERRLEVHMATAAERVTMMCLLAEYQASSIEKMCTAVNVECPRPPELRPEILSHSCR